MVALILVSHHRIQGIDHLVGQRHGGTAQGRKKKRGDDAVDHVFSHRLERRPADAGVIQPTDITPDDMGHRATAGACAAAGEGFDDVHAGLQQRLGREAVIDKGHFQKPAGQGMPVAGQPNRCGGKQPCGADQENGKTASSPLRRPKKPPENGLAVCDGRPHPANGVGQPARIAGQEIEGKSRGQNDQVQVDLQSRWSPGGSATAR